MRKSVPFLTAVLVILLVSPLAIAQDDTVQYFPRYYDPVIEEMEKAADSLKAIRDSITGQIRKRQKDEKEAQKKIRRELRYDVSRIAAPAALSDFTTAFHFPPVAQYRTGTCWSFSSTSFIESEVARITGREIKLSEMHTVYYEYLAKVRRVIHERGVGWNGEGSEANALLRVYREHGAVPAAVYTGLKPGVERHDHSALSSEVEKYLEFVKANDYWDEDAVLAHVRVILNTHLGEPPSSFEFEGKTYTPQTFLGNVLKINPDDYVDVMSTLSFPYFTQGPFEVPDNWWFDSTYYNLPLDQWYGALVGAIKTGYTAELGGDVSEPGWYGKQDLAVVPDFDVPPAYINEDSREFRYYNRTTTDDHGIHLIGHTQIEGRDWFLIKDSGRSARHGKFEGYYFMRDDYLRLKMMTFTVRKDALGSVLETFPKRM